MRGNKNKVRHLEDGLPGLGDMWLITVVLVSLLRIGLFTTPSKWPNSVAYT